MYVRASLDTLSPPQLSYLQIGSRYGDYDVNELETNSAWKTSVGNGQRNQDLGELNDGLYDSKAAKSSHKWYCRPRG